MKLETGQDNLDDAPSSPEFNERPEQYDFHEESDNADNESSDEDEHNHVGHYLNPVYNLQDLDTDDDDDTVNSQEFGGPLWRYHANQMEGLSLSEPENEPQEMEPNEIVNIVQEESSESSEMDSYSSRPDESDSVEIIEEINEVTNNLCPQEPLQATNNILNLQIIGERFMNWFRANYADIINILCTDPAASIYPIPMRFFSPRSLLVPKNYSNENDGYESTQSSISSLNSSPSHSSNNIAPGNFVYTTPQSSSIHYHPTVLNPANSESTQSHPAPISTHYGPPINQRCPPGHFYTAFYAPRIQTPAPRANPPRAFYYVPIYRPQIYRGYPGNPSAHYNASYYRGYPGPHATDYNTTDNQGHTPFYSANYDASYCDGSEGYNSSDNEEYAGSYSENCRASWKGGDEIVSSDEYGGSDNEDYGNTSENYSSDTENDIDDSMGPYLEDCNASNSHIGPSSQEYNERPNYTYTGPYLSYTDPRTYKSQNTYMNFNDQNSPSYPCSSFTNSNGQYLRYPNVQYIPRYVRPYYINYSQPTTRYAYPCYINSNGQYVRGIPRGAYPMHYNGQIRGYTPVHYVLNYNYRMCYQTHIRYPGPHSGYYQAPCHYVNVCADSINSNASNNLGSDPDHGGNYPNFPECHDTGECLGPDSEITN